MLVETGMNEGVEGIFCSGPLACIPNTMVKEEQINIIAFFETGKDEFSDKTLKNLCGGREFIWHRKAPEGHSGGILLGADLDVFNI
jgi:hypothetical protein